MAWIRFRFFGEWIAFDDPGPVGPGSNDEIRVQRKAFERFGLQELLERGRAFSIGLKDEIAALQERFCIVQPEVFQNGQERGHGNLPRASDIDAAKKSNV